MELNQDPRIQIDANLDDVQKDIENAAKERKDEIKNQADEDMKSVKNEMKDLKQEAKDSYKEYKERMKDSDDPYSKEKISAAKEAHKIINKDIEADYQQTKDQIEKDVDYRVNSIDNMFDDSKKEVDQRKDAYLSDDMMI